MGTAELKNTTFLIDFGIAKQYHHPSSCIHIPMKESYQLIGMPAFTSINSHLGCELSQRDDIEALAYTLMFLYSGSLPWLGQGSHHLSGQSIQLSKVSLGTGCPPGMPMELFNFLSYTQSLSFTQKPDYDHLRSILLSATSSLTMVKETQALSAAQVPSVDSDNGTVHNTPQM